MTRLVIATVGIGVAGIASWKPLIERVSVSESIEDGMRAWRAQLEPDAGLARSHLRTALRGHAISPREVPPEVGGLFVVDGPLSRSDDTNTAQNLVLPDGEDPAELVLIASDTRDGVAAAVAVAVMLSDVATLTTFAASGEVRTVALDCAPTSPDAPAFVGSATVLVVDGLDATRPKPMADDGLPGLGLALFREFARAADAHIDVIELALTGGFKSVSAHVPQAVGLAQAALRRKIYWSSLPAVMCFTTFEPFGGAYQGLRYPLFDIDLIPGDWATLDRVVRGDPTATDIERTAHLGPMLVSAETDGVTSFGRELVSTRFPRGVDHPLIGLLEGYAEGHPDPVVVREHVSDALDDLERDEARRGLMAKIHEPFDKKLAAANPPEVWQLGAEQLVSAAESREGVRSLRLVPVNELGHLLARARIQALSGPRSPSERDLGSAPAVAALNRWIVLLRRRPGETAARTYEDLDTHASDIATLITELPPDQDDRSLMLDTVIRGALLPQFRLLRSFDSVRRALHPWPVRQAGYCLAGMLAITGPTAALAVLAVGGGRGWWSLAATATIVLAIAIAAVTSRRVGVAATHPFAPRLLGSCAIGTVVLAGLGDLLGPLLRGLMEVSADHSYLIAGVIAFVALLATSIYLLVELAVNATPTRMTGRDRCGRVLVVAWLGFQYSLAGACLLAPIRVLAIGDDTASPQEAFARAVPFAAIVVVASLALVIGVLSQLFWQDRTAVDPL